MKYPLIIITLIILTSCRMTQETFNQPIYGNHCPTPELVESVYTPYYMTLAEILKYSKDKYGKDVSVANVHYDVKASLFYFFGSKRKSSIFDVVRCK